MWLIFKCHYLLTRCWKLIWRTVLYVSSTKRRQVMKKFIFNIAALSLLLLATPMAAQAEAGWTKYKPGLVKSAIARGETVLLGYLSSWWGTCTRQKSVLKKLRASHPEYDKSITFILIDWDTFSSHTITSSMKVPRRSTIVGIKDGTEIGRLVGQISERKIKVLLDKGLK